MEITSILDSIKQMVTGNVRVRLMFDPPQNAFLVTAIKEQIDEGNFYIEMYHKPEVPPVPTEPEDI